MKAKAISLLVTALAGASSLSFGQTLPVSMVECEDFARCSTWTFHGAQGAGKWTNGAAATLFIQQFDNDKIIINRSDVGGAQAGLKGVYKGTRSGQRIDGTMTWTWPGNHVGPPTAIVNWHATLPASFPAQLSAPVATSSSGPVATPKASPEPVHASAPPVAQPVAPRPAVKSAPQPSTMKAGVSTKATSTSSTILTSEIPEIIATCQDQGGCSNWHFKGKDGKASWQGGQVADLTVLEFDSRQVVIHRVDPSGPAKGLTATYSGTRNGALIEGTVTWLDPSGSKPGKTPWHALLAPPPSARSAPSKSKTATHSFQDYFFCEDTNNACDGPNPQTRYLWSIEGSQGKAVSLSNLDADIELTVGATSQGSFTFYRKDMTGPFQGLIGMYTGTSQNGFIRGSLVFFWPGWGKPLAGKWAARVAPSKCDSLPEAYSTPQMEENIGMLAKLHHESSTTFSCYLRAAEQGDAQAENEVGLMYVEGDGTSKSTKEAINWFSKSGDQYNKMAMHNLSLIFRKGIGVPVDSLKADYFDDLASERQRQLDLSAKIIQPGLGSLGFLIGALAGAPLVDTSNDPLLDFRITHEGTVITKMNDGMSRVRAEETTYKEETQERKENHFQCNVNDLFFGSSSPTREQYETNQHFDERRAHYEQHLRDHPACPTGDDDAIEAKNQEYLVCVHKFVDSEKIQANCHLY